MTKQIETEDSNWTNLCSCTIENTISKFKTRKEYMEKERNTLKELVTELKTQMEFKSEEFEKQFQEDLKLNEIDVKITEIQNSIKPETLAEIVNFENYNETTSKWDAKMESCLASIDDIRKSLFSKILDEHFVPKQKLMLKFFEQYEDRIINLMVSKQRAIFYIKLVSLLIKAKEGISGLMNKDIFIIEEKNIDSQIKICTDEIEEFLIFIKTNFAIMNDKELENNMKSRFENIKRNIIDLSELMLKNSKNLVNVSEMEEKYKLFKTDVGNIDNQINEYSQFIYDTEYTMKFLKKYKKYKTRSFKMIGSIAIINDSTLKIDEQNSIIEILKFDIKAFDVNYEKMKLMNTTMVENKNYMLNEIQSIMTTIKSFMDFMNTTIANIETNITNYNQYIEYKHKVDYFIELMEMCQTELPVAMMKNASKEDDYQNVSILDQIVKTYNESIVILDEVRTAIFQLPESKLYKIETLRKQYNRACDYEINVKKLISASRDNSLTQIDLSNILKQIVIVDEWLSKEEVKLNEYNIPDMIDKDLSSVAQNILSVLQLALMKIFSNLRNLKNYIDDYFTKEFHPIERKKILEKLNTVIKHYNSLFTMFKTKRKIVMGGVNTLDTERKVDALLNNQNDILNVCESILKLYSHNTSFNVKLKMEHIEEASKILKDDIDKIENEIENLTKENNMYERLKTKVAKLKSKRETFDEQLDKIKILIEDIKISENIDTDISELDFNCRNMENIFQEKYFVKNDTEALVINNFIESMENYMEKYRNKQQSLKKELEDHKHKNKPYVLSTQLAIKNIEEKFLRNQTFAKEKKTIIGKMINTLNWFDEGSIILEYWKMLLKEFIFPIDSSKILDSFIYEECKNISIYFSTKITELLKPEKIPELPDKDILDSNILIGKVKGNIELPNGVLFEAKKGDYIVVFKKLKNDFMVVENGKNRAVIKSEYVEIMDKNSFETNIKNIWKFPLKEVRDNRLSELKSSLSQSEEMFYQAEKTLQTYEEFKSEHKKLENISKELEFMLDQMDYLTQNFENLSFVILQQEHLKLKKDYEEKSKELDVLTKDKSTKTNDSYEKLSELRESVSKKIMDFDKKILMFNPCYTSREASYPKVLELRKKLCLSHLLEKDVMMDCETVKTSVAVQIELKELESLKKQIFIFLDNNFEYISNCHKNDLDEIIELIDKNTKILQKVEKYKFYKDILAEIKTKYSKYTSWAEYADIIIKSISYNTEFEKIEINRSEINAILSAHDSMSKDIQLSIDRMDQSVFEPLKARDVEVYLTEIKISMNNNKKQFDEIYTKIDYLYYIHMFNREISYFEKNIEICENKLLEKDKKIKKLKLKKKFHSYIIEIFDKIEQKIENFFHQIEKLAKDPAELLEIQEKLIKCKNRLNNIALNKSISVQDIKNLKINSKIKNILSFYLNNPSYNYNTWKYVKDLHTENLESYDNLKKTISQNEWIQFFNKTKRVMELESKIKEFGSYFTNTQTIFDTYTKCLEIYSKIIYKENILINIGNSLMNFPHSYKNFIWYKNMLTEINSTETEIENLKAISSDFIECQIEKELKNYIFIMEDKFSIVKNLFQRVEKLYEADEKINELENSVKNALEFPKPWYGVLGDIVEYFPVRAFDITKAFNENEIIRCSNLWASLSDKEKKLNAIFIEIYTIEEYFEKFQSHHYLNEFAKNFENYKQMLVERKNSFNLCSIICEFIEKSHHYLNETLNLQSKIFKLKKLKKITNDDYLIIQNESEILIKKIDELIIRGENFKFQLKYLNIFKTIVDRLTDSKKNLQKDIESFSKLNEIYSKNKIHTELFNTSMKSLAKLEMEYEEEVLEHDNINENVKKSFDAKLQEIMSTSINPFMDIKLENSGARNKIVELYTNQKEMIEKKLKELRTTMGLETVTDKALMERLKNLSRIESSMGESVWNKSRKIYDTLLFLIEQNTNISNTEKMEANVIRVEKEIESLKRKSILEQKKNLKNSKNLKIIDKLNVYLEKMIDSKNKISSKVNEYKLIVESENNLKISLDRLEDKLESLIRFSYNESIEPSIDSKNLIKEKDIEISSMIQAIGFEVERSLNIKRNYLSSSFADKKTIYAAIEHYFSSCTILYMRLCQITFCLSFVHSKPNFVERCSSLDKTYNQLKFILKSKFEMNDVEYFLNESHSKKMSLIKRDIEETFTARNNFISYYYLFFLFFNAEMQKVPMKKIFLDELLVATNDDEKIEHNKEIILKFATPENIEYFRCLFDKVNGRFEFHNICEDKFY